MKKEALLNLIRNAANLADSENMINIANDFDDSILSLVNNDPFTALVSATKAKNKANSSNNKRMIITADGVWDGIKNTLGLSGKSREDYIKQYIEKAKNDKRTASELLKTIETIRSEMKESEIKKDTSAFDKKYREMYEASIAFLSRGENTELISKLPVPDLINYKTDKTNDVFQRLNSSIISIINEKKAKELDIKSPAPKNESVHPTVEKLNPEQPTQQQEAVPNQSAWDTLESEPIEQKQRTPTYTSLPPFQMEKKVNEKTKLPQETTPESRVQKNKSTGENWGRSTISKSFFDRFKKENGEFFQQDAINSFSNEIKKLLSNRNTLSLVSTNGDKNKILSVKNGEILLSDKKTESWRSVFDGKNFIEIDSSTKTAPLNTWKPHLKQDLAVELARHKELIENPILKGKVRDLINTLGVRFNKTASSKEFKKLYDIRKTDVDEVLKNFFGDDYKQIEADGFTDAVWNGLKEKWEREEPNRTVDKNNEIVHDRKADQLKFPYSYTDSKGNKKTNLDLIDLKNLYYEDEITKDTQIESANGNKTFGELIDDNKKKNDLVREYNKNFLSAKDKKEKDRTPEEWIALAQYFNNNNDIGAEATSYEWAGSSFFSEGEVEKSKEAYEKAKNIYEKLGNKEKTKELEEYTKDISEDENKENPAEPKLDQQENIAKPQPQVQKQEDAIRPPILPKEEAPDPAEIPQKKISPSDIVTKEEMIRRLNNAGYNRNWSSLPKTMTEKDYSEMLGQIQDGTENPADTQLTEHNLKAIREYYNGLKKEIDTEINTIYKQEKGEKKDSKIAKKEAELRAISIITKIREELENYKKRPAIYNQIMNDAEIKRIISEAETIIRTKDEAISHPEIPKNTELEPTKEKPDKIINKATTPETIQTGNKADVPPTTEVVPTPIVEKTKELPSSESLNSVENTDDIAKLTFEELSKLKEGDKVDFNLSSAQARPSNPNDIKRTGTVTNIGTDDVSVKTEDNHYSVEPSRITKIYPSTKIEQPQPTTQISEPKTTKTVHPQQIEQAIISDDDIQKIYNHLVSTNKGGTIRQKHIGEAILKTIGKNSKIEADEVIDRMIDKNLLKKDKDESGKDRLTLIIQSKEAKKETTITEQPKADPNTEENTIIPNIILNEIKSRKGKSVNGK